MLIPSYFQWVAPSHDGQPSANFGASIVPAQNAKGAWSSVMAGALVTEDVWEIEIRLSNGDVTTQSRDILVDIGIDLGGGFAVIINNLMASFAGPYLASNALGISYRFPLHIPAGATIGARASINNADLTPLVCSVVVAGDPSIPAAVYKGAFVRTLGATPATSSGTTIISGTVAEGAWTLVGNAAEDLYFFQVGWGANDASFGAGAYHIDLAVGPINPPSKTGIVNLRSTVGSAEQTNRGHSFPSWVTADAGDGIYVRLQGNPGNETAQSVIAYGVGGDGGNVDYPASGIVFPPMAGNTTAPAICQELLDAIRAIVPVSLSTEGFVPHQEQTDFTEWAISAGSGCLRRVSVRFNEGGPPLNSGYNYEIRRDPFTVLVAYPTSWRSGDSLLDMQRIIDQDRHAIEHVCGWRAGFATFTVTEDDYNAEYRKVGDTTFLELTFTYEYTRSMV